MVILVSLVLITWGQNGKNSLSPKFWYKYSAIFKTTPVSKYPSLRMLKILILFVAVTSSISEVLSFEKREAQTQNCFGSNCNQNNGVGFFPFGFPFGRKKREAQTQNCLGGNCNQNNGVGFFPFGFPFGRKKREAQTQNCFGSNCN